MKSPTRETKCAEGIFQMQYPICAVNFTNQISKSSWPWRNLWKFLPINFKNKYFHNSVDWSRLYPQVYIPSWLAKILRFAVFRLLENAFVRHPCPYYHLNINPPSRTVPPINLPKIIWPPSAMKGFPPYFMGRGTMLLLHWKILWGRIPQYLQESAE